MSQSDQLSNLLNNTTNCSWVRGQHYLRCQVSFTISSSMKSSFSFTSIQLCHLIPNSSVLFSIGSIKACILLRARWQVPGRETSKLSKKCLHCLWNMLRSLEKLISGLGRTGPCLIHSNPIIPSPQYPLILKLWEATLETLVSSWNVENLVILSARIWIHKMWYGCNWIHMYHMITYGYYRILIWGVLKMGDPKHHGFQNCLIFGWFGVPRWPMT